MTSPTALCAAPGCRRTPAAGQLCESDSRSLGDWLAQIGAEYDQLDAAATMQGREVGTIGGTTLASHRSPSRLDVLVLRDPRSRERCGDDPDGNRGRGALEVLASWAATVRGERGLAPLTRELVIRLRPERPPGPLCGAYATYTAPCRHESCRAGVVTHTVPAAPTVATERRLLAKHLGWALSQDWVGEFYADIRAVWGLLRAANGNHEGRPVTTCPTLVDGARCGGPVHTERGAAWCGECAATWSGAELLQLGRVRAVAA